MSTFAADARLTPEEREAKKQEAEKKQRAAALFKKDLNETFAPGHGRRVLRWLMEECGYQRPSTSVDPNSTKILSENMLYNEARRNLYLKLRQQLDQEILIPVENKGLEQDEVDIFS